MVDRRPTVAAVDRPDYDGITPSDALPSDGDNGPRQASTKGTLNELT
jgi:hypothetical protein